jgi:putative addiction module CopG family antidote
MELRKTSDSAILASEPGVPRMTRPLAPADLPEEAARFVEEQISAGRFADVAAFITAGKNARTKRDDPKRMALRAAIDEGEASGIAERDSFAWVRAQLGVAQR